MRKLVAEVVERGGDLIIYPLARAESGVLLADRPVLRVPRESPRERIGDIVRRALDMATEGVPHPGLAEHRRRLNEFLGAVGVRKWSTFVRGARMTFIREEDAEIVFIPTLNRAREGFQHLPDSAVRIPSSSDSTAIGEALATALGRSS